MSFSGELKNELCSIDIVSSEKAYSELLGIILFSKNVKYSPFFMMSDSEPLILRVSYLLDSLNIANKNSNIQGKKKYRKKIRYFIDIKEQVALSKISNILESINVKPQFLSDFVRGVFLACGNISNPQSNYHMEFVVHNDSLKNFLISSLNSINNFKINPNHTTRRNANIVYIKESEIIVDLLTFMGATKASMDFIQNKMVHELRNYVNRTNNFETANISKTSKAASAQIDAINKIKKNAGLDALPKSLREIANLRLANPYMSLSELSNCLSKPLSRSGINHRLKKIVEFSLKFD